MKKLIIILTLFIVSGLLAAQEEEGIQAGDREISVYGQLRTQVGVDYDYAVGNFNLSYGKYTTAKLLIGFAPGLTVSTSDNEVKFDLSAQFFFNYNFTVNKKIFLT